MDIACLTCVLCNCTAQVSPSPEKEKTLQDKSEVWQADSKKEKGTSRYRIISAGNTYTLRWTGKAFTSVDKDKVDTRFISKVVKGLDAKWLRHSLLIATKDVWVLKDSVQEDVITIIALKSAETGWGIGTFHWEYFTIDECKAPLYAVPYFINGSVYVICMVPSFQFAGNEVRPAIDRKTLYEDILKPLIDKFFP